MGRYGRQIPSYSWCDTYARTQGGMASALADAYGISPHEWQRLVLNDWLALDDDGKLLNTLCLLPVPRQNGKTGVCEPRETAGLLVRSERILHTAQEYQTAKVAFDRLREKFGDRKNDPYARFPELNALVDHYTTSANQMVLDLKNGAHIEFRTRGNSSDMGRGGTFDLVVVDEAQAYTEEQEASLGPLNSAAPSGSPQTILMGTVPLPGKGDVWANARATMHENPTRGTCIHEWAASEIGDVTDRDRWYENNPSLGLQLIESALLKDSKTMSADTFAREHLGWWPPNIGSTKPISEARWKKCATANPPADGLICYGVKFSPDGSTCSLAVCLKPDNGIAHVEVIDTKNLGGGITWLVDWLAARFGRAAQVTIDGQSNAQSLVNRLNERHAPQGMLYPARTRDVVAAATMFADAVKDGLVTHYDQPDLNASALKSNKRKIGADGGWGFGSTDYADSTLVEACALAYWGAMTTKRNPRRKQVIG